MNVRAYVAEFIGTFALIFVGVGAIAADHVSGALGLTGIALAHGLTIAVMVSATMAVSGGHLNPAVTIGLWSVGKIDLRNAVGYVVSQCLGAVAAAAVLKLCVPGEVLAAVNLGTPAVNSAAQVTAGQAFVTEIVLTFFLVFVIYGTAVDARAHKVGGLFIGLTIALDIMMGGPISGAAMNPARHFGPALLGGGLGESWIYWFAPIIGGLLAARVYRAALEEK